MSNSSIHDDQSTSATQDDEKEVENMDIVEESAGIEGVDSESESSIYGLCHECASKDEQIMQLENKLHQAIIQKQEFFKEFARMKKIIKEMQWRIDMRGRGRPPPLLPNDILKTIFSYATQLDGLSHSPHHHRDDGNAWKESLRTRHAIPLVCRKWREIGTQFLYKHIHISTTFQADLLLKRFTGNPAITAYVHGLEFAPNNPLETNERGLWHLAGDLITSIPRLRILALTQPFDPFSGEDEVNKLFGRVFSDLEVLQLSEVFHSKVAKGMEINMPKLHTLSFIPEIDHCGYQLRHSIPGAISLNLHALYLHLDVSKSRLYRLTPEVKFSLGRLTTLCLGTLPTGRTTVELLDLDMILDLAPELVEISFLNIWNLVKMKPYLNPLKASGHPKLHSILIHFRDPWEVGALASKFKPLFMRVENGRYPALESISVIGGFADGCVDAGIYTPPETLADWSDAIRICQMAGVELISERGLRLYLWSDVYCLNGLRLTGEGERPLVYTKDGYLDVGLSATTDDGSWTEDSGEGVLASEWDRTDGEEEEEKDDDMDPGDSPYVYQALRDIRKVDNQDLPESWSDDHSDVDVEMAAV